MSNVPDYRSPEQAHYETVRDLRARLERAERELEHYKSAYEEAEEINRLSAGEIYNIERQRDEARGLLDRAHDSLNELLAEHINIASPAAEIAKRGLRGESK